ncbi:extracellular calcium-sensing receptor-like [Coregonus clupeaformis]|uniref:extracellular calcium-sensing receptor-like n=1 Tax=Coregonus clupeaformis TaxID=59861 RepID=UPI001E1C8BCE|nr:extracellular calcium-sensing receptor-like [Coregonus clupeaformis]
MCLCGWLGLLYCLHVPGSVWGLAGDGGGACRLMAKPVSGSVYRAGDVVIGGLFPIHVEAPLPEQEFRSITGNATCTIFNQRAYRWFQTMIFAVEEINRDPTLLPNLTLGFLAADTCLAEGTTLGAALAMVTGQEASVAGTECGATPEVPVIIGDARSSASIVVAQTLGPFDLPMVSYFATCACLSDNWRYPSFFRTVPSDAFQALGMARLLRRLGWVWVGLVSGDGDYGKFGVQVLLQELQGSGVCVAYSEVIPKAPSKRQIRHIVDTIRGSTARVVVTFVGFTGDSGALMEEVVRQNITDRQWIASEAWVTYSTLSTPKNLPSLAGTIGFALKKAVIPGLGPFLTRLHPDGDYQKSDPFLRELWEEMFGCSLGVDLSVTQSSRRQCTGSEVIREGESQYADVSQLRASYNVYKAVYAIAYAIQDMLACRPGEGAFNDGQCPDIRKLQPSQIVHYLRGVNFSTPVGESFHFDMNGEPPASYDIINWHVTPEGTAEFVQVGHFLTSEGSEGQFHIDMEKVVWGGGSGDEVPVSVCSAACPPGSRHVVQKGRPVCCFDCLSCAEGEISNTTGSVECIRCPERFWSNPDHTACIPQLVDFLSYSDTMGVILSVISVSGATLTAGALATFLYHRHTALVKANNSELSFLLLLSLKLCFLCALVFIGQPKPWTCMLRHTLFGISFVLCISCLLSRTVVVLVAFRASLPGENLMRYFSPAQQRMGISLCTLIQVLICVLWLTLAPPRPAERGGREGRGPRVVLECEVGSVVGFSLVLGYIGLLASICLLLAFLARKLPDNFNEAKFITFSMLIFCAVWISFIPAYVSSPGKYTVAVEIFAILASSFGLLFCLFAPKCFIILLRPERNTKKHMMAK